jgi:hypothetical protein
MLQEQSKKVTIFVSYSHQDKKYLKDASLLGYLRGLRDKAEFWWDERITTGDYWDDDIKENIQGSSIALVLVSQAFLNSAYVNKVEIPSFMKKRKDEGMVIFPIVLSACQWAHQEWLAQTQFLPREGRNIESHFRDPGKKKELFLLVYRDLEQQIDRVLQLHSVAAIPSKASFQRGQPPEMKARSRSTAETTQKKAEDTNRPELQNPFDSAAANNLDFEDIPQLFVGEYTPLDAIKRPFDALIEGQRGTGKTMVLKYLAFETQARVWSNANKTAITELQKKDNFVGIYSRLDQGVFDRSDLDFVDEQDVRLRLFEHRLVLFLLSHVLRTTSAINKYVQIASAGFGQFTDRFAVLLQEPRIRECLNWDEFYDFAQNTIDLQVTEEDLFLGSMSVRLNPPETFNAWLTLSSQLIPLLELTRKVFSIRAPFFLLLDDFDVLRPSQQTLIFSAASARRLEVVAFKYGVMSLGKKTDMSGTGRRYREGDDYSKVSLDFWSGGGQQGDYRKAVEKLTAKRLEQRGWPERQFGVMLAEWARGRELREETKNLMRKEWKQLSASKRPKTFENYWTKYGNARFFQLLAKRKIRHLYAGYDTVVDVSSGIYRQYVELCSQIVSAALTRGWRPNSEQLISSTIQDGAIRSYSGAMKDSLSVTAGNLPMTLPGATEVTSKAIATFVDSLSSLFKSRLASFGREPEIFSIAIRGDLNANPTAKALLDVAVRESILHHRADYTPKTGGGQPLPTYMLNRRLAPRIGLGLRIQGRIEVTPQDVVLAAENPDAFLKRFQDGDTLTTGNLFEEQR